VWEYISFANCGLPYYIGKVIKERDQLFVTTAKAFHDRYNIDIRIFSEVVAIDRKNKQVTVKNLKTGKTYTESYDKIILSPGAEPTKPPIEGIDSDKIYTLRNIPDMDLIKAHIDAEKPTSAVVVGGGFIGLEMAENIATLGVKTTIIEMLDQVMAPLDHEMAAIVQAHLEEKGVTCKLGNVVKSFTPKEGRIMVTTDKKAAIECDMVILSIGIKPENRLARDAGLDIGERGNIKVNAAMRTSDPDIYAVGDAVEVKDFITGFPTWTALAGPANKQGRIAADNAMGRKSTFKGTMGTMVVKVFDMTVASTGASEKTLKQHQIPYLVSYTHSRSHAVYYPGAKVMAIKLIFSPSSGKVLGSQIIGGKGVDKRIDVIATAIRGGMTVYDLEELELAYAPPYSSAKDPVNIAGYVSVNMLQGDMATINWDEIGDFNVKDNVFIDVRNKKELEEAGLIPGALHIPLPELRSKLSQFDKDKNYIIFCAVGLRSYLAQRIFTQNGFTCISVCGGYRTYLGARSKIMKESPASCIWLGGE